MKKIVVGKHVICWRNISVDSINGVRKIEVMISKLRVKYGEKGQKTGPLR